MQSIKRHNKTDKRLELLAFVQISKRMSIFRRTGDARAMLAHCKSLMAFEQKGGFAMVEGADWVPSACLKVACCHLSRCSERLCD